MVVFNFHILRLAPVTTMD